jgi:hypothetical protein
MQIDLLPPWAQKAKARRKRIKILAAVQAVVFLLLATVIFFAKASEREAWNEYHTLSAKIDAFDPGHSRLADELAVARAETYIEAFDSDWLDFILDSTPDGAVLQALSYNDSGFLISARTHDILTIEAHIANLSESFTYVSSGRLARMESHVYAYEIKINSERLFNP